MSPHIIIFYSDWCFPCMRAAPTFRKIIDSLENFGVVFASVNSAHESRLCRKIGIHMLPAVVLVIEETTYVYKEPGTISTSKIVDFIKKKLPYKLLLPVDDSNIDEFLNGWHDNKVRALILEPRQQPRLRYLITAFNFKSRVHFGFVQTLKPSSRELIERYKVNQNLDSLLLFNEDSARPVASVSMTDISTQTLTNIISANQYLALPRLSSQGMLDGICPAEWNRPKRRLCVILITENSGTHDYARQVLRRIAVESTFNPERVKYAYIYKDKQKDFVNSLSTNNGPTETLLKIVVIWRRDHKHVKYEWIQDAYLEETTSISDDEDNYNKTKQKLDETIQKLLKTSNDMTFSAEVKVSY
jgi:DnaJ homolog subfamily C member 16